MPALYGVKPRQCWEDADKRNTCKHYRKTIRRCVRKWADGREPNKPCDGWCSK
ncbi:MAG: hypothetical protein GXY70_02370 [Euryarchaeota archaeon]|nr:hypothetical protein [Euryarchaeota archaeon]